MRSRFGIFRSIRDAIVALDVENGIGKVREFLGDGYSYGDIRAVVADFLRDK